MHTRPLVRPPVNANADDDDSRSDDDFNSTISKPHALWSYEQ